MDGIFGPSGTQLWEAINSLTIELLTVLQILEDKGLITDQEYFSTKSKMTAHFDQEVKRRKETGDPNG